MSELRSRAARAGRRFLSERRGATAVEFSLIALPFFMLVFGVMELGLLFMASTTVEGATITAAREVRTGELQTTGTNTAAGFKTLVCNNMSWLSSADCTSNVSVDVRTFATFANINVNPPIVNGAIDQAQMQYNAGQSCDIVLVRVFYPYTLFTPLLEPGLPNLGPTQRLVTSAAAFRNENWAGANNCGAP
jgi:Flp pilus assembly protein TadG